MSERRRPALGERFVNSRFRSTRTGRVLGQLLVDESTGVHLNDQTSVVGVPEIRQVTVRKHLFFGPRLVFASAGYVPKEKS